MTKLGAFFSIYKWLRQGDPMSLLLFNLVVDYLSVMIRNAQEASLITGLIPHLQENIIVILRYVDYIFFAR